MITPSSRLDTTRMDESDLRLVRLVARHYTDMQGLRTMLLGTAAVVAAAMYLGTRDELVEWITAIILVVVVVPSMAALDRHYAQTFGRAVTGFNPVVSGAISAAAAFLEAIDRHMSGMPSLMWLFLSIWPGWLVYDCWPRRRYYLLLSAAMLLMSVWHVRVPADLPKDLWLAQGFMMMGIATVAAGFADHRLLTSLMPPRADAAGKAPDDDTV